jgi:hypothetical protein
MMPIESLQFDQLGGMSYWLRHVPFKRRTKKIDRRGVCFGRQEPDAGGADPALR